ncbi:MAG TPA: hypothetical protein VNI20_08580, partial [Fimbriimonadaceae bacterium]|nr:hypothetical protein [Fimbriimonadaceae bacterium]
LIATRAPVSEIEAAAKKAGFKPMTEHAAMKLERGETDEREISNVFSRPIAQEPLDANLEGMVPETEAKVEAAAVEKTEAESARDEYAEEIKKERDEMNAFLKMQSYEYDTGYIDDAA